MRRLVWAFVVRKPPKTGFLALRPICKQYRLWSSVSLSNVLYCIYDVSVVSGCTLYLNKILFTLKALVRLSRCKGLSESKLVTFANVTKLPALSQLIYLFFYMNILKKGTTTTIDYWTSKVLNYILFDFQWSWRIQEIPSWHLDWF